MKPIISPSNSHSNPYKAFSYLLEHMISCDATMNVIWDRIRKKSCSQYQPCHITRNELLVHCTIIFHCVPFSIITSLVFVAAYLRSCVNLKWYMYFGTIGWSWLFFLLVFRGLGKPRTAGQYFILFFSLKGFEHKEGPVGPQFVPLAFNHLCAPFYALTYIKPPHPLTQLYTTTCNIKTLTEIHSKSLRINRQVFAINSIPSA